MAFETSAIGEVPKPSLAIDKSALLHYLHLNVPSVFADVRLIDVLQLTHGQSNPTYVLKSDGVSWILRKKPGGKLLPSAHQIEREAKILTALAPTDIPVPRIIHVCADASVVGTPFYIMEHVNVCFLLPKFSGEVASAMERRDVYRSYAETLARLHCVDPMEIGLKEFGKTDGYCQRQVRRWWKQYLDATETPSDEMTALKKWLESHIPGRDNGTPPKPTISHGDFLLNNIIFAYAGHRWGVRAVVDWELSTLGDAWADVAFACLPFYLPFVPPMPNPLNPDVQGIPSEAEFVKHYAGVRQTDVPLEQEWAFYKALALFRLASICQGVGARAHQGNAASTQAPAIGSVDNVTRIAQQGIQITAFNSPALLTDSNTTMFQLKPAVRGLIHQIQAFMDRHIFPFESTVDAHSKSDLRWTVIPKIDELKSRARAEGLWNLFISPEMSKEINCITGLSEEEKQSLSGRGLTNVEYCFVAEQMGRCVWASVVFNCSAPDTGNMEILSKYGTEEQKHRWLLPLLKGEIRSCFAMTEKLVASSDATNIQSRIVKRNGGYVLSGKKWYTTGAMHPSARLCIFMGVEVKREMLCFGYDDAPFGHPEIHFQEVWVPVENRLGNEGEGFEIAQSRLGPGRLHHCMRLVGMGARAMEIAKGRVKSRVVFGKTLAENDSVQMDIGHCAVHLQAARLLVLSAADALDRRGNKKARAHIAAAKIFIPQTIESIIDRAIQMHGGSGLSDDTPLARMFVTARSLRIADGPDEVHTTRLGKDELLRSKL